MTVVPKASEKEGQRQTLSVSAVRKKIENGDTVYLAAPVEVQRKVTPEVLKGLERYSKDIGTVPVKINGQATATDVATLAEVLKDPKNDVRLNDNVMIPTWWKRAFVSTAVTDLTYGNIVVVGLAVLGFYGVFMFSNRVRNAEFLIETESELKKVDWSSKEEVFGSTRVVLLLTLVFLIMMTAFDAIYEFVMVVIKQYIFKI